MIEVLHRSRQCKNSHFSIAYTIAVQLFCIIRIHGHELGEHEVRLDYWSENPPVQASVSYLKPWKIRHCQGDELCVFKHGLKHSQDIEIVLLKW